MIYVISARLDHLKVDVSLEVRGGEFVQIKIAGDDDAVREFVERMDGSALPPKD